MKRLTDEHWRNFNPWECCGQDKYCQRGCHDEGGCANGCIVPKLYARLARYEDTGLEPEELEYIARAKRGERMVTDEELRQAGVSQTEIDRLFEIAVAESEGRLVVLPCKVGDTLYAPTRNFVSEFQVIRFDYGGYENPYLWVNWYLTDGITGNFRIDGISDSEIGHTAFLTREEAEAALRKEQENE